MTNGWLFAGGVLSAAASLLHLACLVGGAGWYRALGAGERMARAVERGATTPHLITLVVAAVLAAWAAYALSGAGAIGRLPLLRPALVAITGAYLLRGAALPFLFRLLPDRTPWFVVWSSLIVLGFGIVHAIGLYRGWSTLGQGPTFD